MSLERRVNVLSWNLRRAGFNKIQNETAMKIIYNIISNNNNWRDIVLLQEVISPFFIETLGKRFMEKKTPYKYVIEDAKYNNEYYVIIFNKKKVGSPRAWQYPYTEIELSPHKKITLIRRPPFGAYFPKLDLCVIDTHIKPPEKNKTQKILRNYALEEITNLKYIIPAFKHHFNTENILLGGDYNLTPPYWNSFQRRPFGMKRPVAFPGSYGDTTTSIDTFEAYDHFICDSARMKIVDANVLNFRLGLKERVKGVFYPEEYNKNMIFISDHWPIEITLALPKSGLGKPGYALFSLLTMLERKINNIKLDKFMYTTHQ